MDVIFFFMLVLLFVLFTTRFTYKPQRAVVPLHIRNRNVRQMQR